MKILLIEDDRKTAKFIKNGLHQAGYTVEHASDGKKGLFSAITFQYDLAIIDIMLPEIDGISIIDKVRQAKINTPIIVLSAKSSVDDRIKGLERGCDDYLTKPFSFSELLARIQALLRRANAITEPSQLSVGDLTLDILSRKVFRAGKKIELQPLEYNLLEYLMRHQGRVVSKTMIIEHVWEYNFDPGTNVVEARICKLREKIDKGFKTKLIHTVRGFGYLLECREEE